MYTNVAIAVMGFFFSIIGYLLQKKDLAQEEQIKTLKKDIDKIKEDHKHEIDTLWSIHNVDAERLHNLEVELAKQYYPKGEMDERFKELDRTVKEGFKGVRDEVSTLNRALMSYLQENTRLRLNSGDRNNGS